MEEDGEAIPIEEIEVISTVKYKTKKQKMYYLWISHALGFLKKAIMPLRKQGKCIESLYCPYLLEDSHIKI